VSGFSDFPKKLISLVSSQGERGDCELCKCLWFLAILLSHLILFFDSEISLGIVDEGEVSTKQGGVGER